MLEADGGQSARIDKAAIAVQCKGSIGVGIDDDGDDLPNPDVFAPGEQRVEQTSADTASDGVGCQIDRVLDRVSVRGPRLPLHAVRVARDIACNIGSEERQTAIGRRAEPPSPFAPIRGIDLEGRHTGSNVVGIDVGYRVEVVGRGGPDGGFAHADTVSK